MKREIKFRGLRVDGKGWAYGMYMEMFNRCYIIESISRGRAEQHHVDPKTIGQFTGLKDKNGKEIYEGDIVELVDVVVKGKLFEIRFEKGSFVAYYAIDKNIVNVKWGLISRFEELHWNVRVIGNIHEYQINKKQSNEIQQRKSNESITGPCCKFYSTIQIRGVAQIGICRKAR